MRRNKLKWVLVMVSILASVSYGVIVDNFDTSQNYVESLAGTIWDGWLVNDGLGETQDGIIVTMGTEDVPGNLTFRTTLTHWNGGSEDDGALLYQVIPADTDFSIRVLVTGGEYVCFGQPEEDYLGYMSSGPMIRGMDPAVHDFVSLNAFDRFGWSSVYNNRSVDDGAQTDGHFFDYETVAETPYMRLDRTGSNIDGYVSADGVNWEHITTYSRPDLTGQVQVGLAHAMYTNNTGTVTFDDFSLDAGAIPYGPTPKYGQGQNADPTNPLYVPVEVLPTLSWATPEDSNIVDTYPITYDVYMGTDEQLVADGDPSVLVSDGQSENSFTPAADLTLEETYYWNVVADLRLVGKVDPNAVPSAVWTFTVEAENLIPVVNAGDDIVTWLDGVNPVDEALAGVLEMDDEVPAAAGTTWTVLSQPDADNNPIDIDDPSSLTSSVTMSVVGQYTLRLTGDDGVLQGVDDLVIDVYADACDAAKGQPGYEKYPGDADDDCDVDLADLGKMAQDWLKNNSYQK